jgi:hypothetical protein
MERAARGRTFEELRDRCLVAYPRAEETLDYVLRDELRLGRVCYDSDSGRYVLNGGLDPAVREALLELTDSAAMMK